jgi:hypothetical protein
MKVEKGRICSSPIYKYEPADALGWQKVVEKIEREAQQHHQSGFAITIERYGKTIKLDPADKCFGFFIAVCAAAFYAFVICLSVYSLYPVPYSCYDPALARNGSSDHQKTVTPSVTENGISLDLFFHSFSLFVIVAFVLFFKLFTFIITFVFTP